MTIAMRVVRVPGRRVARVSNVDVGDEDDDDPNGEAVCFGPPLVLSAPISPSMVFVFSSERWCRPWWFFWAPTTSVKVCGVWLGLILA
ncbi:hypothetical protein SUGI_0289070 [Cryptomeria japonica]|nr:hypothetical protein SUGI_0289070 [Cryptomeria japonica]